MMGHENNKKPGKIRNVLRTILLILTGIILGVNLYLANASGIVGNQLPMPFGYGIANVLSGSMEPTFSPGTLLLVKEEKDIKTGDIVVYQSGQSLVVHRVVSIDGDTVVTKGDANNTQDEPFNRNQIKGIVIGWIPGVGNLVKFLKTPVGIILILVLAFFLLEGSFRKKKETDEEELEKIRQEIQKLKQEIQEEKNTEDNRKN